MKGPGVWELQANRTSRDAKKYKTTSTMTAIPTPTHMMFVKLYKVTQVFEIIVLFFWEFN